MAITPATYNQPEGDDQFLRCREYLYMREMGVKTTMPQIAEHFQISLSTLHRWIDRWTNSGMMAKCRAKLQGIKFEDIDSAETDLLADWPNILRNMQKIAKSESYRNAIEAAKFLEPTIDRLKTDQDESAVPEADYVDSLDGNGSMFDPLDIPPVIPLLAPVVEPDII